MPLPCLKALHPTTTTGSPAWLEVGPAQQVLWLVLWSDVLCMELSPSTRLVVHRKGQPGMAEEEELQHTVCVNSRKDV